MLYFLREHRFSVLLSLFVFIVIYIFFAQIHPVYPYDADDWSYLYHSRGMYPATSFYNPTRILPEILMPFAGEIAMAVVYPMVGDITISVCITSSIILALFITTYIVLFYRMLLKRASLSGPISFLLSILFLLFHFLFFRNQESGNEHLFYSFDLCCHYNYTIPNIVASSLVLLFVTDKFEYFNLKSQLLAKGILLLFIYLVCFSHLFGSIILISYLASYLLVCYLFTTRKSLTDYVRRFILHIIAIIIWLGGLFFEINGKRADTISKIKGNSFVGSINETIHNFLYLFFDKTNTLVILFICIVLFAYIIYNCKQKTKFSLQILAFAISAVICSVFIIMIGAKTYPYYILRSMTSFSVPFYVLLVSFVCLAFFIKKFTRISTILPFFLVFIYCDIEQTENTFLDVQTLMVKQDVQGMYRIPLPDILEQNNRNIRTIINAERQGKREAILFVPQFKQEDNWPIPTYYGKRLSRFLDKYGFLPDEFDVAIQPDKDKFKNFNLK